MTPTARVVYKKKRENGSTNHYMVMVNPEELTKWKKFSDSDDLVADEKPELRDEKPHLRDAVEKPDVSDVVDGPLEIYHEISGGKLSKQELAADFNASSLEEAVKLILKDGYLKGSANDEKNSTKTAIKNESRGSRSVDTRGNSLTGI